MTLRPTSAFNNPAGHGCQQGLSATSRQTGFTFLEILVAITIIGLVIGTVIRTLPASNESQLEQHAQQLHEQLRIAQQQAVFKSQDLGLLVTKKNYQFYEYKATGWQAIQHELSHEELPEPISISLILENQTVHIEEANEPQIWLLSDGQTSDFRLTLRHTDSTDMHIIKGSHYSPITLTEPSLEKAK